MCDCFKSTGNETTETRTLSGFTKIDLNDNVDLILTPGRPYSCKVTAGSHLIDLVTTEVKEETLIIKNNNTCNWVRSFKNKFTVEISLPHLYYVYYAGSGIITTTDSIHEDEFGLDGWTCSGTINLKLNCNISRLSLHTGTADLYASGTSGVSYVYNAATGPIHAENLETGYTYIGNRSTNDCYVQVTKELGATITLQGNIFYSGNPYKIDETITGSGKLVKIQ